MVNFFLFLKDSLGFLGIPGAFGANRCLLSGYFWDSLAILGGFEGFTAAVVDFLGFLRDSQGFFGIPGAFGAHRCFLSGFFGILQGSCEESRRFQGLPGPSLNDSGELTSRK